MSKNLESEYRKLMNDQIPDLWDRIEAGLGEQLPAEPHVHNMQTGDASLSSSRNVVNYHDYLSETERRSRSAVPAQPKKRPWKMIAGIAAAAACVCIIVPVALSVGSLGHSSSELTAAAYEEAVEEGAAFEPKAEAYMNEAAEAEEFAAEAAAGESYEIDAGESAPEAAASETYDAGAEEAAAEEPVFDDYEIALSPEAAEEEKASASEEAYAPAEAAAEEAYTEESASEETYPEAGVFDLAGVRCEIASIPEKDLAEGRIQAVIVSCPADPSLEGTAVTIFKAGPDMTGDGSSPDLPSKPGTYTLDLRRITNENGEQVYYLTGPAGSE